MSRTIQVLLAGVVLPAFALGQPIAAAANDRAPIVVAQQDKTPDQQPAPNAKPGQQPGKERGRTPPGQKTPPHPSAQQPGAPKAVQQPAAPQRPTAQQPAAPQRPTAQQPTAPQRPTAQQPTTAPTRPTAQQPATPSHPTAQQPATTPQRPTAQQPSTTPQRPTAQQPATTPPAAQRPGQVHPSAQVPAAAPQRPTAQTPAPAPQPPTAQSPAAAPQRPTAQQPGAAPPAAAQRQPGFSRPTAQQPQATPPAAAAPQVQPPAATAQQAPAAPAAIAAPVARDRDQALQQRQRAEEWRSRRVQDLHNQRQQVQEGNRTVIREPDRTIIKEGGKTIIRHDEVTRFGFKARDIQVQQRGRDTVTVVERPGGIRIVTVVDADGRLLRRSRRGSDGREIVIIDNPVHQYRGPHAFFVELPPPVIRIPRERYIVETEHANEAAIYAALTAPPVDRLERRYTLEEVRYSPMLRDRMPRVDLDTVTFESGSWEVMPEQAGRLAGIADAIRRAVEHNPQEVFLIEGHTDAVGSDVDNLSLSDRRAESVAVVLSDQFGVPPENLTTQGYGEQNLKIPTEGPERRNRRVTVRRITPLLVGENGERPY